MSTFIVIGLLVTMGVAVEVAVAAVMITLLVKDILAERRRAKAARTGFPWAWDK